MLRTSIVTRIALSLALLIMGVVCAAGSLGLIPDTAGATMRYRTSLCELLATQCALGASEADHASIKLIVSTSIQRNKEVLSAAVRLADGYVIASAGDHAALWKADASSDEVAARARVPIYVSKRLWGHVEFTFSPINSSGFIGTLRSPMVKLVAFISTAGFLVSVVFLRKALLQLDPNAVIPDRVKMMLDTLAEGVVILDSSEHIVAANRAFSDATGISRELLSGRKISKIPWKDPATGQAPETLPWDAAGQAPAAQHGVPLSLNSRSLGRRVFMVNASPIFGSGTIRRGLLVNFNDVTEIHEKQEELLKTVNQLEESRETIRRQNEQLRIQATHDPLTSCLNRRAFFESSTALWDISRREGRSLAALMLDIDHFKRINDTHGHASGDQVLRHVGKTLMDSARPGDVVCRFGGEEFCVLLPDTDLETAAELAEDLRKSLEAADIGGIRITASLGVSCAALGAAALQALIDQADKALYVAKRTTRNRVVRYDATAADAPVEENVAAGAATVATPHAPASTSSAPAAAAPPPGVDDLLTQLRAAATGASERDLKHLEDCAAELLSLCQSAKPQQNYPPPPKPKSAFRL